MRKAELHITPYQSAGPIRFNAVRSENRAHFDEKPGTPAVVEGGMPGDEYKELGLYVMYDKYNRCAGVECFRPASVFFEGKNLLRHTYQELYDYFKSLDPYLVEGPMEFTSYKFGIAVFDPDHREKPTEACEWIAVFRENYFNRKIGVTDPKIFSTFSIQPGFVEGVETDYKTYASVEEAYSDIFRRNKEYMILLWNSFPVKLSYITDIPYLVSEWTDMLRKITAAETGECEVSLNSEEIRASWNIEWDKGYVTIESEWNKISGNYQDVLNEHPKISMLRSEFLYEWKMLFQQLVQSVDDSRCGWSVKSAEKLMEQIRTVEESILHQGKFYRKESLELIG